MSDTDAVPDGLQPMTMLASALAGRTVLLAPADPRQRPWTDGRTIYLHPDDPQLLETLCVQASLLSAGGMDPDLLRRIGRRTAVAQRYLAVEGNRALAVNDELLPERVRSLINFDLTLLAKTADEALELAESKRPIPEAPECFGQLRPRNVVAAGAVSVSTDPTGSHAPRRQTRKELDDLDDGDEGDEGADVMDPFSSPIGGGGVVGKMLQRLMSRVRQLSGGGPPGADSATHRGRSGIRGAGSVVSSASAPAEVVDEEKTRGTHQYPEWDVHRRSYKPNWTTVTEIEPPDRADKAIPKPDVHALRRPLTRLGIGLDRARRQAQGDDIDVDAAVEARVELRSGQTPDEAFYIDSLRRRRDLSVLVLLDVSGSTSEAGTSGLSVHEQQRAAAAALTVALHELGDRVALYAFQSQGRSAVNVIPVKRFDDGCGALALRRLGSLQPGAYSRLGAAIRHGSAIMGEGGGTSRRLLVVLSDGLAYDHGYERVYGAADARRALSEARRNGIGCLCLTIGAATDGAELARVFGSAAHASMPKPQHLPDVIGPLFRSALRTADMRRRIA